MPERVNRYPIVEVRGLTQRFGRFLAVDRAEASIGEGEIFGLVGPEGAGKSTLMRMLAALLPPTDGTATIGGYDISADASEVRRQVGYVPQCPSADTALTGTANLLLSARHHGIPLPERDERIERALAWMDLKEAANHLVRHYSGGMMRRLEIAQGLLHRPKVLLLDEPTAGLDRSARLAVWQHVRALAAGFRTTVIVTAQSLNEVEHHCDRIALVVRGRIVAVDTPESLRADCGTDAGLDGAFIRPAAARRALERSYEG